MLPSRQKRKWLQKAQMLQPLLRQKGASGMYYSRKGLAKLFSVPYHMLVPNDERRSPHQSRKQRFDRMQAQSNMEISQLSL